MDLTPPHVCRERAEQHAADGDLEAARTWALLAIAGELATSSTGCRLVSTGGLPGATS